MDIKYTTTGDLDFENGDLSLVDGTQQHKLTILLCSKGELKHRPDIGVDAGRYLLDNEPGELLREARRNCQKAGMKIRRVYFDNGTLKLEGGYDKGN